MPGDASLKAGQYYAHPRNAFWPIMGELFGAHREVPYERRLALLDEAGVALWDSLHSCVRPGSLDAAITNATANDFAELFARFPKISSVFFNGSTSEALFRRHVLPKLGDIPYSLTRLPSTSPANARLSLAEKLTLWRVIVG